MAKLRSHRGLLLFDNRCDRETAGQKDLLDAFGDLGVAPQRLLKTNGCLKLINDVGDSTTTDARRNRDQLSHSTAGVKTVSQRLTLRNNASYCYIFHTNELELSGSPENALSSSSSCFHDLVS
jgi:hypothetical protein